MAKGNRPTHSIALSAAIRKGKYIQGPSIGLWVNEDGQPMMRGSVKEEYLTGLISFLKKCESKDLSASFAVFKNKKFKKKDEDDDADEDEDGDEDEDEEDEDEEEEEEEEEPKKRKTSKSKKGSSKSSSKKGKKGSWDFDDEDDD